MLFVNHIRAPLPSPIITNSSNSNSNSCSSGFQKGKLRTTAEYSRIFENFFQQFQNSRYVSFADSYSTGRVKTAICHQHLRLSLENAEF